MIGGQKKLEIRRNGHLQIATTLTKANMIQNLQISSTKTKQNTHLVRFKLLSSSKVSIN